MSQYIDLLFYSHCFTTSLTFEHPLSPFSIIFLAYNRIYFCPNPSFSFSPICVFLLFFATKIIYVSQFSVK